MAMMLTTAVQAKINIISPYRAAYNYGEVLPMDGYVMEESITNDTAIVNLVCNNIVVASQNVQLNLKGKQKVTFKEMGITLFKAPRREATCRITASVSDANDSTQQFDVTPYVLGKVWTNQQALRLGEVFTLQGVIYHLDGSDILGVGDIILINDGQKYLLDTIKISKGLFNYSKTLEQLPSGVYTVTFMAKDAQDNYFFSNASRIQIDANILVAATTDKKEYNPGDEIKVQGVVNSELVNKEKSIVTLTLDNQTYTTKVRATTFTFVIRMPNNIRSGKHLMTIDVKDGVGNRGILITDIAVKPKPAILNLSVDGTTYNPEEIVPVVISLRDQANEPLDTTAQIIILNPDRDIVLDNTIHTNEEINLKFPPFSLPGTYWIRAVVGDLTSKAMVDVVAVKKIEVNYVNKMIRVYNLGNVRYEEPLTIELLSNESELYVEKKFSLKPNQMRNVNLEEEVPAGVYDVIVGEKILAEKAMIEDKRSALKKITGGVIGVNSVNKQEIETNTLIIGWVVVIGLLGSVGYVLYKKHRTMDVRQWFKKKAESGTFDFEIKHKDDFTFETKKESSSEKVNDTQIDDNFIK